MLVGFCARWNGGSNAPVDRRRRWTGPHASCPATVMMLTRRQTETEADSPSVLSMPVLLLLVKEWIVVRTEPRPITLIELGWVVLGRVLDLILRQGDEDILVIDVDPLDRPSRDDDLTTEEWNYFGRDPVHLPATSTLRGARSDLERTSIGRR